MIDYFIRCRQVDVAALRALGQALGLLVEQEGAWHAVARHAYQELGTLHRPTGQTIQTPEGPAPEMAPVLDGDGQPYWHANLRFAGESLLARAQEVAAANPSPELTAAVAPESWSRFFVTDPQTGNATRPDYPSVVFA